MASEHIAQDDVLQSLIDASARARKQCLNLLDLAEQSGVAGFGSLPHDVQLELANQQKHFNSSLAVLRGLNRNAYLYIRKSKLATAEARQEIDKLHLQLQNLYYEEKHLRGETESCKSYDHKYQQLPLIPVEEFLHIHPELADADEKSLMLARIDHELKEREALEQQRQELLKKKQKLIADNKKRKEDLADLDKRLTDFIDVGIQALSTIVQNADTSIRPEGQSKKSLRSMPEILKRKLVHRDVARLKMTQTQFR
ncbi:MAG: hypothetical protein Q9167_002591 [Letrouitia subvulpina]